MKEEVIKRLVREIEERHKIEKEVIGERRARCARIRVT
jgi:hypothetical protein